MKPNDEAYQAALRATSDSCSAYQIQNALDAAYAVQFQSVDYAEEIKWLRDKAESLSEIYPPEAQAADALEAVLAERDALKAENDQHKSVYQKYVEAIDRMNGTPCEQVRHHYEVSELRSELALAVSERDALAARLAPVDDEELVEKAAQIVAYHCGYVWGSSGWDRTAMLEGTRAAIAAIRPHIEAAERERCAKIAETPELWVTDKPTRGCDDIAAAIRSRK